MQHIIEVRQKDLTETKVTRLNEFVINGRVLSNILPDDTITNQLVITNIPMTISKIMEQPWVILNTTGFSQYIAVVGELELQIKLVVDEVGHRFVVVYTRLLDMPNTIGSIYVGYDAMLESVNQMFTVTKIKADEWRYCN